MAQCHFFGGPQLTHFIETKWLHLGILDRPFFREHYSFTAGTDFGERCRRGLGAIWFVIDFVRMITTNELIFEAISKGLQATFEAINDLTKDLSEVRSRQVHIKTERIQRARAHIDALIDERRSDFNQAR